MSANLIDADAQMWWWNGKTYDETAFWYTELYDEDGNGLGYPGWGVGEGWLPAQKKFAPGESFWIQVNETVSTDDAWCQMAGEVESVASSEQYYTIPLEPNVQVQISNPFPTGNLDVQSIKMSANLIDADAQMWWWNGKTYDETAFWYTELYDEDGNGLGYPGWGVGEGWLPAQKILSNGEGVWIQVNETVDTKDAWVKFPNPFYVAPAK